MLSTLHSSLSSDSSLKMFAVAAVSIAAGATIGYFCYRYSKKTISSQKPEIMYEDKVFRSITREPVYGELVLEPTLLYEETETIYHTVNIERASARRFCHGEIIIEPQMEEFEFTCQFQSEIKLPKIELPSFYSICNYKTFEIFMNISEPRLALTYNVETKVTISEKIEDSSSEEEEEEENSSSDEEIEESSDDEDESDYSSDEEEYLQMKKEAEEESSESESESESGSDLDSCSESESESESELEEEKEEVKLEITPVPTKISNSEIKTEISTDVESSTEEVKIIHLRRKFGAISSTCVYLGMIIEFEGKLYSPAIKGLDNKIYRYDENGEPFGLPEEHIKKIANKRQFNNHFDFMYKNKDIKAHNNSIRLSFIKFMESLKTHLKEKEEKVEKIVESQEEREERLSRLIFYKKTTSDGRVWNLAWFPGNDLRFSPGETYSPIMIELNESNEIVYFRQELKDKKMIIPELEISSTDLTKYLTETYGEEIDYQKINDKIITEFKKRRSFKSAAQKPAFVRPQAPIVQYINKNSTTSRAIEAVKKINALKKTN